ncbi:MAG TPA: MarR family winged helix-turn-helix transcriptional regulator [Cellulomonas sp.]
MTRDDADDLRRLGVALHDLAWVLRRAEPPAAGFDQLPPTEFQIMRFLDRHPGASVGEVARGLGLQQSNASTATRGLVERGLVGRQPDPVDRRVARLRTTARSAERREPVEASWGNTLDAGLAELDADDADAVRAAVEPLARLAEVVAQRFRDQPSTVPGAGATGRQGGRRRRVR